jgi:hypothetical protein
MPVEKYLPNLKSIEKLEEAGTANVTTGTAVSAGTDVELCNWINCVDVLLLYPDIAYKFPALAFITLLAS